MTATGRYSPLVATWLRHPGADLADIRDLYGRTDADTTQVLCPPTPARQRDAIRRLRAVDGPGASDEAAGAAPSFLAGPVDAVRRYG